MAEATSLKGAQYPSRESSTKGIYNEEGCSVSLSSSFNVPPGRFVTLMRPSPSGSCWIQYDGSDDVNFTDRTGSYKERLTCDSKITGMDCKNKNQILICAGNHIKQALMPKYNMRTFVSTKTLIPRDLCVSSDDDVYVTLKDKADYAIMQHSERVVVRYSPQGQEKARAKYDRQGNLLFVRPNRIIISSTGDRLIVINYTDHGNSHVVILNAKDLSLHLRYLGNGLVVSDEQTFDISAATTMICTPNMMTHTPRMHYAITDIGLDTYDNILVCEFYSRSVRLLTSDCEPLLTILPTQEYVPLLMAVNQTDLWVGFGDGIVMVYSVHCNLEPETIDTQF